MSVCFKRPSYRGDQTSTQTALSKSPDTSFLRVKQNLEEKTVQKQFNNLKWFLNWAIRKGYCTEEAINKYRPKFKVLEKPVIFLTKKELLKLYRYDIPANGTKVELTDMNGLEYEKTVQKAGALA